MWLMRGQTLAFGPHLRWQCKPFLGKPSLPQWQWLLD